jgi:outer membrane protein assembly factor BamB
VVATFTAGCASTSTVKKLAATVVPDCAASKSIENLPAFAVAVSARGRVCWEAPLAVPPVGAHSSSPPLAADGTVFLGSDGRVRAVSLADGRQEWSSGAVAELVVSAADSTVVVTKHSAPHRSVVAGLDGQSGALRWQRVLPPENGLAPTEDGGVLFTAYSGVVSQVIDDADGHVRWHHPPPPRPTDGGELDEPFIADDAVVSPLPDGGVDAVSLRTGMDMWRRAGPIAGVAPAGELVVLLPPPGSSKAMPPQGALPGRRSVPYAR